MLLVSARLIIGTRSTHVRGINDLVGRWVGQDGLGVNTCLVSKGRETSNVVVERNVDFDAVCDQVLDILEYAQLVLGLDEVAVGDDHSCHQTAKRSDTIPLTNSDDGGVDVSCSGFKSAVGIRNGTAGVVVEVALNVTADDTTESSDQVVYLSRACTTDSVCYADSVHTDFVNSAVESEQVDQI